MKINKTISNLCFLIVIAILCMFLYRHESVQDQRIKALESKALLKGEGRIEWDDSAFNYLAVGNSITLHPVNEYWWQECGMAATSREKDYVHRLIVLLTERGGDLVKGHPFNLSAWELLERDRAETLSLLDTALDEKIDLITIQLGENCNVGPDLYNDYLELIRYIQTGAPNAMIIMIDDFWDTTTKAEYRQRAADEAGIIFCDLSEIKGVSGYQCGMGTIVYDENGMGHEVSHNGVAGHLGDLGMKYIAESIYQLIP